MRKVRSNSGVPAKERLTAFDLQMSFDYMEMSGVRIVEQASIVIVECPVGIDKL